MNKSLFLSIAVLGLAVAIANTIPMGTAYAQDGQIYGSQLMTEQERTQFRSRMQAAASDQEREQIRWEHHLRIQERANGRGITLPDEPPMFGMHQQPGRSGGSGRPRLPNSGGGRRGG